MSMRTHLSRSLRYLRRCVYSTGTVTHDEDAAARVPLWTFVPDRVKYLAFRAVWRTMSQPFLLILEVHDARIVVVPSSDDEMVEVFQLSFVRSVAYGHVPPPQCAVAYPHRSEHGMVERNVLVKPKRTRVVAVISLEVGILRE